MPDYKNAPIQEAVCEFTFAPLKGNPDWDLTLPGKLQIELPEYSGKSRQQLVQTIVASPNKNEMSLQQALHRVHVPMAKDEALLSLGHNILGVVCLKPYEGWKKFQPRIVKALKAYIKLSGQTQVTRLGLRYINRMVAPAPDASTASKYLTGMQTSFKATEPDGKTAVTGRLTALNSRHEFETPEKIKVFVTHATLNPEKAGTAEYLLDLDTVWDHQPLDGISKITPVMEKLHAIESGVFESLITPEARKIFNA
jgi:uncharacterized protein (TIGR04255 family)